MVNTKVAVRIMKLAQLPACVYLIFSCFCTAVLAKEEIVAVVNNDVITQKDMNDFANFMRMQLSRDYDQQQIEERLSAMKKDMLDRLIEDRLILQEAKKADIKIDESRVKERLAEIKKRYGSENEFTKALAQQGQVLADVEEKIREQILMYAIVDRKIRSKILINPGEITDYYYKNINEFRNSQEREFETVMFGSEMQAKEVYDKLKAGSILMDLALQYSFKVNKLNAYSGGELRKDIEQVVFSLKLNEFSPPVKIDDSYYIFIVTSISPAKEQTLDEVRDQLYKFIFDKKLQEGIMKWLDELRKNSYIKISK